MPIKHIFVKLLDRKCELGYNENSKLCARARKGETMAINWNKIKAILKEAVLNIDPILFACATTLSIISIITVWGAVDNFGMSKLRMQVFIFVLGIFVTVAVAFFDFRTIVDK